MKKWSKVLTIVLCAICLVAASVLGTIAAIMVMSNTVTNTFTVGKIDLDLDESDVNELGVPVEGAERVTENTYKLYAGQTYTKDPVLHIGKNSENCYVFIEVNNEIANIETKEDGKTIADQIENYGWENLDGGIYWKLYQSSTEQVDYEIFDNFMIGATTSYNDLLACEGKTITITAYAIQQEGITDEYTAWAQLDALRPAGD